MEWSVDNALTLIGLLGGVTAFGIGLRQYRKAQHWKRAEWVAQEMKGFLGDHSVQVSLQIIDWGARRVCLFPDRERIEERYAVVTDDSVAKALRQHDDKSRFTEDEVAIRDAVDRFLDGIERFESYVTAGLIEDRDLRPYLHYWAYHISASQPGDRRVDRLVQLKQYADYYGFSGARSLLSRLGADPYQSAKQKLSGSGAPAA